MLYFITGPPRAGKSYFIVNWIFKNYLKFNKETLRFELKEEGILISNVEGLKLPHKRLDDVLEDNKMEAYEFFTKPVQSKLAEKYPLIIYVIDEAHIYFPAELSKDVVNAQAVRNYFAYHGHYNQHFLIGTQDVSLIFKSLVKLGETEYCCLRNTIQPPGRFAYNLRVPGKIKNIQRITLVKSQKIFDLYQTSDNEETQKPKKKGKNVFILVLHVNINGFCCRICRV